MSTPASESRFLDLLAHQRTALFRIARAYARDVAARQDLVQDIVLQLWRSFPDFDAARPFAAWMKRIALNVAFSQLRRDYRRPPPRLLGEAADLLTVDPAVGEGEAGELLQRTLDRLGDLDRALLLLHLDGHHRVEIADVLGISPSNVATRLHRIRQRLRQVTP